MTPNNTLAPLDPLQGYSIAEAIRYERSSRATIYKEIAAGKIKTIKRGRRRIVPGSELVRRAQVPQS